MNKIEARLRRSRKTRVRIALQRATRLVVSRSNCHIYAQIVERAKALGIESVAFDRSGFRYHGRVQALADAAREHGLKF